MYYSSGAQQCSAYPPRRKYYLTTATWNGDQADESGVCEPGFHLASFWEIHEPSTLRYDTTLGDLQGDSGEGPPSDLSGWVRTGFLSTSAPSPGDGNCNAWTSDSGAAFGTIVNLTRDWDEAGATLDALEIWVARARACDLASRVWCIQD